MIGLIILFKVFWWNTQQPAWAGSAGIVSGTVVELIVQDGEESTNSTAALKIEFLAADQQTYIYTSPADTYPYRPRSKVGDKIRIFYNPENPQEAVIAEDSNFFLNSVTIGLTIIGLTLLSIGTYRLRVPLKALAKLAVQESQKPA